MSLNQPTALLRWSAPLLLAALAVLFAASAITKAMDVDGFARLCERILSAAGLPYQPGMAIAVAIILIEAVLAFLLGARVLLSGALIASLGVLLAFVAALTLMVISGGFASCGCGGALSWFGKYETGPQAAILRNIVLMWIVLWLWRRCTPGARSQQSQPQLHPRLDETT